MKILVDTCIWSRVFRRRNPDARLARILGDLISDGQVAIIGPIRQEILSGISEKQQFKKLNDALVSFEDIPLESEHFTTAAEFSNICRKQGIQGSATDFLICAVAHVQNLLIFTSDDDFKEYEKYLPIRLLDWESR